MSDSLIACLQLIAVACISSWALWKGGRAERIGATLIIANTLIDLALAVGDNGVPNPIAKLTLDGVTALAFVGLTVRFASNWLGAVMLLFGAQFALNAYYFVMNQRHDLVYIQINNIFVLFVCISLAAGVLGHLRSEKALANAT